MNQILSPIELRLTDICRWHDVERGWLQLTVGNRQRRWSAIWQTNLRFRSQGDNFLPRGTLPLTCRTTGKWMDCPRLKLKLRTVMWVVPLETAKWNGLVSTSTCVQVTTGSSHCHGRTTCSWRKHSSGTASENLQSMTLNEW